MHHVKSTPENICIVTFELSATNDWLFKKNYLVKSKQSLIFGNYQKLFSRLNVGKGQQVFFFAFIYLFIMFYGFQCSWLNILLMGSIALACFLCWVRIFNIICYILLYITLEVLMTFKCNFVTCNILFHFNSVDDWPNLSNWMVLNQVLKKYFTTHLPL